MSVYSWDVFDGIESLVKSLYFIFLFRIGTVVWLVDIRG